MKTKEFKFTFKKHSSGGKIVSFKLNQLGRYRYEAQLDFISIFLLQVRSINPKEILLDWSIQEYTQHLIEKFNGQKKSPKCSLEIHRRRSLMDYCSNYTNLSAVSDFELIMVLLEDYYNWMDNRREQKTH